MADLNEGIVEQYAEHLLKKASSVVVSFAVGGAIGGAALGAIPGLISHSVISPGASYFAVLLGAIAGGFLGRTIGDKRAVGLRLQAQMALRQLQIESRLVSSLAAPVGRPAAPAPASVAAAPPAVPAPSPVAPPTFAPSTFAPAPALPPAIRTEPTPVDEPPALPPLTQLAPPLSAESRG